MGSSVKQASGIRLQSNSAHFISLGNSRLSTEVTLFDLPIGNITIGSSQFCDIVLKGKGIKDVHCRCSRKFSENDLDLGDVFLTPVGDAKVCVEGDQITDECLLQQGCMITLGDSIFLRFNFPAKAAILKNTAMENNKVLEKSLNTNSVNFTEYNNSVDKSLNNNVKITEKMKNLKMKANDSYPKISNLQVYPVASKSIENCANITNNNHHRQTSIEEMEELEDVLKMFVEYNNSNGLAASAKDHNKSGSLNDSNQSSKNNLQTSTDKINASASSSTTHQNRIKTNGSLPKNFHTKEHSYNSFDFYDATQSTDDIENYKKPQSPRTRIKTFVSSPTSNSSKNSLSPPLSDNNGIDKSFEGGSDDKNTMTTSRSNGGGLQYEKDYEKLIKSFEDKFRRDIFNIQNCEENFSPTKNSHKDDELHTNNHCSKGDNSAVTVPSSRSNLSREKNDILAKIRELKILISESERQESETFLESDVEKNLVLAEMTDEKSNLEMLNEKLSSIKAKMKQLEIERMKRQKQQEIQQIKLKNVIKDKEAEIKMIKEQREITVESEHRLDELQKSLESDKKTYEDLEFHYLEEETDWASLIEEYKENIHTFTHQIAEKKNYINQLEQTKLVNETSTESEQKTLETKLFNLKQKLENEREKLKTIDKLLSQQSQSSKSNGIQILNTSAFDGSAVRASSVTASKTTDIMSKSFNENMFYNRSKIEVSYFDFTLTNEGASETLPRNSKIALKSTAENRQSTHSDNNASPLTIPKFHSLSSINRFSTDNLKATPSPPIEGESNVKFIPSTSQKSTQQLQLQQQQQQQSPVKVQYRQSTKQKRPLTRYLPNFSLDFNLRQHIETAGHQLQLCPHVIIDASSCRGYLNKVGSKPLFSNLRANTRWFVFDRQRQMFVYYSDKGEKKPRGGAYFNAITDVYFDHSTSKRTFIVKTKSRTFTLQAPSTQTCSIWIDVICTGAQGKIFEYEK